MDVSIPEYISDALKNLQHDKKPKLQYSPHEHFLINYGKHDATQYTTTPDNKPTHSPASTKYIQSVTGTLLYYARALDASMLPALSGIIRQQAKPTAITQAKAERIMDYIATYPDAYLRCYASDIKLNIHSDASYLVLSNARSRIAGYYFFRTNNNILNAPIHVEFKTLKHVVSSAAECEKGGISINRQNVTPLRDIIS